MIHLMLLLKEDFFDLKSEVDKLDIDKVVNVPNGLSNVKASQSRSFRCWEVENCSCWFKTFDWYS